MFYNRMTLSVNENAPYAIRWEELARVLLLKFST